MNETKCLPLKCNMRLMSVLGILFLLLGCKEREQWRTDSQPITSRFPIIENATALTWVGGTLNNNCWLSVPGKNTYFIKCFVEGFSQAYTNVSFLSDFEEVPFPSNTKIPRNLNLPASSKWYRCKSLEEAFSSMKYRMIIHYDLYYESQSDILYLYACWE